MEHDIVQQNPIQSHSKNNTAGDNGDKKEDKDHEATNVKNMHENIIEWNQNKLIIVASHFPYNKADRIVEWFWNRYRKIFHDLELEDEIEEITNTSPFLSYQKERIIINNNGLDSINKKNPHQLKDHFDMDLEYHMKGIYGNETSEYS